MSMEFIKLLLLLIYWVYLAQCQKAIPKSLRECYTNNNTLRPQIPLNLRVLVDIIRKAEKHTYTTMDMRIMSSSLLHRFKFDGIEYHEVVNMTDGILPFSATGSQRVKQKLIEELVSGNPEIFPVHTLTKVERCVLHWAISNTIVKSDSQDIGRPCQQIGQTEKLTGRAMLTGTWNCPKEYGVVLSPYGTVALGVIISTISASLQRQSVAVNQLLIATKESSEETSTAGPQDEDYNEEEVDFVLPKHQMIHGRSMWHRSLVASSAKIDNVWLTAIAGELAEMVTYQGPLVGPDMTLGDAGFWNNTMRPGIYYLLSSHTNFDATRAELMGGIDALIIANYLQTWVQNFYSLRLSQILDMYYSDRGIAFDTNVKACERGRNFLHAIPKTVLSEQTYAIAQTLAYRKSIAFFTPEALQRMVGYAVDKFSDYAKNHLFADLPCHQTEYQPRVEALIVFDGAWSIEYTADFLSVLIQDLDVSMYGSKIGIIHGTSGEWMLNVTDSPSHAFQTIHNFTDSSWPTQLNYSRTLETVFRYLNTTWEKNKERRIIGNLGQVVVLLIPLAYMSNSEKQSTLRLLQTVKSHHPDVHFVYYTSRYNANLFKSFVLSDEDYIIKNSNIDAITRFISTVPRTLRPIVPPKLNITGNVNFQFEDYISPSKFITYRLHPHWRRNAKKISVSVHSFGYGAMKVCSWTQFASDQENQVLFCKELSGHNDIILTDNFKCGKNGLCPDSYYRVQNVTSAYKCAEIDCKTPDQVRFIIRMQGVHYKNLTNRNVTPTTLTFVFLFGLQIILPIILR